MVDEEDKEKVEIKKEEPVVLATTNDKMPPAILPEKEAKLVIDEITYVCNIAQSSQYLEETTQIQKSNNFYIDEIFRIMKEAGLIIMEM